MSVRPRGLPCLPPMNRSQLAQPPRPAKTRLERFLEWYVATAWIVAGPMVLPIARFLARRGYGVRVSYVLRGESYVVSRFHPPGRRTLAIPDLGARRGVDVCDTIKTSWVAYNFPEVYSPPPRDAGVVAPLVLAGPSFMRHRVAAPRQRSARRTTSARRSSSGGDDPPSSGDDDPPGSLGGPRRHRALARRWCR